MRPPRNPLTLSLPVLAVLAACAAPVPAPPAPPAAPPAGPAQPPVNITSKPVISALDFSPKTAVSKNDRITFAAVVLDNSGQPLQYTWTSTKGTLSANVGSTVSWQPTKADGSLEPGLSTVMVVVSNGSLSTTGNLNIQINGDGSAIVGTDGTSDTPVPTARPSAPSTPEPTPTPKSTPTPAAPTPTPIPLITAGVSVLEPNSTGDPFADGDGLWNQNTNGRAGVIRVLQSTYEISRISLGYLSNSGGNPFTSIAVRIYTDDKQWRTVATYSSIYIGDHGFPSRTIDLTPPIVGSEVQVEATNTVGWSYGNQFKIFGSPTN